ncbi:Formylglycine-generating enzyme, required for sulfatase activity, contains SUMF1/FGE domain [Nannocystis exedens]|uniref:Formylglycine-generating enzyme, required for sulfatase activity, contains SUMF1/FGE domain n=1 Tax=Nannocystis exedens TaxID=54 RepID=A0A1I1YUP7_9BACT|nr:SUMF1/EgtB/PvdO family nonheme iron enzyme [Nannocystis exedens]PCC70129.1 Serine/threonine-protein kinase pkn1 [Nannocystis exedens]SFE23161.1 Formylglycine-generating enzyme, required for sulfatase activity, contains SUMF1/FGE domain [Nannocystis exedens]
MTIWLIVLRALTMGWMPPEIDEFRDEYNRPLPERKGKPARRSAPGPCRPGMALIEGGSFASRPIAAFCLDTHEVTVGEFHAYVQRLESDDGGKLQRRVGQVSASEALGKEHCTWSRRERAPQRPMNCVAVDEAAEFCESHGKRLPKDLEWKWAARGGTAAYKYPGSNHKPTAEWLNMPQAADDRYLELRDVGSYAPTPSGLHDMAGNVWEWVACTTADPRCSARGGGFATFAEEELRAAFAGRQYAREARSAEVGFRCAATPDAEGQGR